MSPSPSVAALVMPTGLSNLDCLAGGGVPGDVWVLAGRAGVGKHLLALGIARHLAVQQNVPVRWLTNDDPRALHLAMLAAGGRVPTHALGTGNLTEESQRRIDAVSADLARAPLTFHPWTGPHSLLRDTAMAAEQPSVRVLVLHGEPVGLARGVGVV